MRRLFALVFFMILLFVFISCSETTPFKTDETKNDPTTTEKESEKLPETGVIITTESIPPQTISSSTTTTTTIPPTTTTIPLTTTIKPTTKVPPVTTTLPPTTTTTGSVRPYNAEGRVTPNKHLTWDEAYTENGDGTFTVTYRSGWVAKYYPHPYIEGHFTPSFQFLSDMTIDRIKGVWDLEICRKCGEFSTEVEGYVHCIRYIRDKNCPDCGEWVKAMTCHYCAN